MTLYHEVEGSGPTVVFIHESVVDSRVWDTQWSSFEAYRRVRFDLRGFGRTPVGSLPLSHARDVVELLDELEATELNLRMWVDGLGRKPADVDPRVREAVREMQRHALELQAPLWEQLREELLVEDIGGRLGEVRAPTLVLVGEEDVAELHAVGDRLAREIPDARFTTIPRTAHVPHLERPADFAALVLDFPSNVFAA